MRTAIDASGLKQFVTFDVSSQVPDGDGGYTDGYVALPPPDWARVEPATSYNEELPIAGTTQAALTHKVTLRYRPDVTRESRVTFVDVAHRQRVLYIRAMQTPLEQGDVLILWCEEKAR